MSRRSIKARLHAAACPKCGGRRYRTVKKGKLYRCRGTDNRGSPCGFETPGPGGVVTAETEVVIDG